MAPAQMTLVCFAVKEESWCFERQARSRCSVDILLTGMGKQNASRAVAEVLKHKMPKLVLSAGFAGGLRQNLESGTVLFSGALEHNFEAALLNAGAHRGR